MRALHVLGESELERAVNATQIAAELADQSPLRLPGAVGHDLAHPIRCREPTGERLSHHRHELARIEAVPGKIEERVLRPCARRGTTAAAVCPTSRHPNQRLPHPVRAGPHGHIVGWGIEEAVEMGCGTTPGDRLGTTREQPGPQSCRPVRGAEAVDAARCLRPLSTQQTADRLLTEAGAQTLGTGQASALSRREGEQGFGRFLASLHIQRVDAGPGFCRRPGTLWKTLVPRRWCDRTRVGPCMASGGSTQSSGDSSRDGSQLTLVDPREV